MLATDLSDIAVMALWIPNGRHILYSLLLTNQFPGHIAYVQTQQGARERGKRLFARDVD